jgi:hypothetical protein
MFFKRLLQSSTARLLLIALVLCGITLTTARSTDQAKAAAAQSATSSQIEYGTATTLEVAPNATSDQVFVRCTVANVGVGYVYTPNTVGFHSLDCSPSTGEIQYFSVPADSKKANQVLAILLTAKATGRPIAMIYDPNDTSGIPPETVSNNRKILTLGLD